MNRLLSYSLILLMAWWSLGLHPLRHQDVYQKVKEGKAILIDIREKEEIQQGMIEKAQWKPLSQIQTWKNKLPSNKLIYLYCRSGKRAKTAVEILKQEKITASNLGGYEELKARLFNQPP